MLEHRAVKERWDVGHVLTQPVERIEVSVYRIPTESPESDATLQWTSTALVLVEAEAGGCRGTGYTYGDEASAELIQNLLRPLVEGSRLDHHRKTWESMVAAVRNIGVEGIAATAISAIDTAIWDLRGHLLGVPLVTLLGSVRDSVPVYGSGGFTSYDAARLERQLHAFVEAGMRAVKIKVGRDRKRDPARVRKAREVIGDSIELLVDGNNAYTAREATREAWHFFEEGNISWLEQPVSQSDIRGTRFVREHGPPSVEIADGEYGYLPSWFLHRIQEQAADVFMPDVTRCLGLTGFLQIAALCEAASVPISWHCAPALHATIGCIVPGMRHGEYFHDHARIERAVFDGFPEPDGSGHIRPSGRPGFGLAFRRGEAERIAGGSSSGGGTDGI